MMVASKEGGGYAHRRGLRKGPLIAEAKGKQGARIMEEDIRLWWAT